MIKKKFINFLFCFLLLYFILFLFFFNGNLYQHDINNNISSLQEIWEWDDSSSDEIIDLGKTILSKEFLEDVMEPIYDNNQLHIPHILLIGDNNFKNMLDFLRNNIRTYAGSSIKRIDTCIDINKYDSKDLEYILTLDNKSYYGLRITFRYFSDDISRFMEGVISDGPFYNSNNKKCLPHNDNIWLDDINREVNFDNNILIESQYKYDIVLFYPGLDCISSDSYFIKNRKVSQTFSSIISEFNNKFANHPKAYILNYLQLNKNTLLTNEELRLHYNTINTLSTSINIIDIWDYSKNIFSIPSNTFFRGNDMFYYGQAFHHMIIHELLKKLL